jgi:ABC-type branched-subunit amino acid transport system substrate-binding protein
MCRANPKFFLQFFFILLSTAAMTSAAASRQVAKFQVRVLIPLSGTDQKLGSDYKLGFTKASQLLTNEKLPLDLRFEDTKGQNSEVLRLYEEAAKNGVDLIISPFLGWSLGQVHELSTSRRVPTISLSSQALLAQRASPNLVHFSSYRERFPQAMAIFAKDKLKSGNPVVLFERGVESSWEDARAFADAWKKLGGRSLKPLEVQADAVEFAKLVAKAKAERWETVYTSLSNAKNLSFMKLAYDAGLRLVFLGTPEWLQGDFYQQSGPFLIGHYFPVEYFSEDPERYNQDVLLKHFKASKLEPSTALAFDSLLMAARHWREDPKGWWKKMLAKKDLECLSGCEYFGRGSFMERRITILSTQQSQPRFYLKL